jgi:hypothetical protein
MFKMTLKLFEGIGFNITLVWVSLFMTPIYFILASIFAHSIEYAYEYSKAGNLFLGDISYMMPLSVIFIIKKIE